MTDQRILRKTLNTALLALLALGAVAPIAFAQVYGLTVTTDKSSYKQGDLVTISGGLTKDGTPQANALVGIEASDSKGTLAFGTIATTGTDGKYSAQFKLRGDAATGTYTVTGTASVGGTKVATGSATFTVASAASLTLTPTRGAPGTSVAYTGAGFTAGQTFTVALDWSGISVTLASGTVASGGTIGGSLTVPGVEARVYTVVAQDGAGLTGTASFGVEQAVANPVRVVVTTPVWALQGETVQVVIVVTVNGVNTDADVSASHVIQPDNAIAALPAATRIAAGHYVFQYPVGTKAGLHSVHGVAKAAGFTQYGASRTTVLAAPLATAAAVADLAKKVDSAIAGVDSARTAITSAVAGVSSKVDSAQSAITGAVGGVSSKVDSLVSQVGQVNSFVLTVAVIAIITLVIEVVILLRVRK